MSAVMMSLSPAMAAVAFTIVPSVSTNSYQPQLESLSALGQ